MKLVRLIDAAESHTPLGAFLGALMREFKPDPFVMLIGQLERNHCYLYTRGEPEERRKWAIQHCRDLHAEATKYGLTITAAAAMTSAEQLEDPHIKPDLSQIPPHLRRIVTYEMQQLSYLEIHRENVRFFDPKEPLFGQEVHDNFASSRNDIVEAGKCFALERSTAAVMHLMRALEPALFAMATMANLPPPTRNDWGKIIGDIEDKLNPKSPVYIQDAGKRDLLAPAAAQFRYFKDAWRNHAMHAREKYTQEEASAVWNAVRPFMMHLAKKGLKE